MDGLSAIGQMEEEKVVDSANGTAHHQSACSIADGQHDGPRSLFLVIVRYIDYRNRSVVKTVAGRGPALM